jgi:SAM-dependent methyltransferase
MSKKNILSDTKKFWENVWDFNYRYISKNNTKELPWDINTYDENLKEIIDLLNLKKGDILELGCGSGNDIKFLSKRGFNVTGIDISEKAINIDKINNKNSKNVKFIVGDVQNNLPNKTYDIIYDRGCIHNIKIEDNLKNIFEILSNKLKFKGKIIIITGNSNDYEKRFSRPNSTTISEIEFSSNDFFKIKLAKEIEFKLNKNYGNALGWLFLLEKR